MMEYYLNGFTVSSQGTHSMKTKYSPHTPLIDEARHQYSPVFSIGGSPWAAKLLPYKQLLDDEIKSRKEKKEWKTCGNCLAKNLRKKRICITCGAKQITEDVESMSRPSASIAQNNLCVLPKYNLKVDIVQSPHMQLFLPQMSLPLKYQFWTQSL